MSHNKTNPGPGATRKLTADEASHAASAAGDAVYVWDCAADTVKWSENSAALLERDEAELPCNGAELETFNDLATHRKNFLKATAALEPGETHRFLLRTRSSKMLEERVVKIGDADAPKKAHIYGVIHQHTPSGRLGDANERTDELTGFITRTELKNELSISIASAITTNTSVGYMVVGIDNLQHINDAYGFGAADDVIVTVGDRLTKLLGPNDSIGRIGGAKYGVIAPQRDAHALERMAQKMRAAVREQQIVTQEGRMATTISVGMSLAPDNSASTTQIMSNAEFALRDARYSGNDRFAYFEGGREARCRQAEDQRFAEELLLAISENRLGVAAQPIVTADSNGRRIAFYECLARLTLADGSLAPARLFMPIAEKLGLVRLVDEQVMRRAFDLLRSNAKLRLSVNVSPQTVQDEYWLRAFEEEASTDPGLAERLIVEVTESSAMSDMRYMRHFLEYLQERGCAIALDDFGAGYTSFSQLRDLKIDIVKIDGSFMHDLTSNLDNQLFVRALVAIAENFEMMSVAEFVDDIETAEFLADLGVNCFQGYMFGKPQIVGEDWCAAVA